MTYEIASVLCGGPGLKFANSYHVTEIDNRDNHLTPCQAYQEALSNTSADVLIMLHDDVTVHEPSFIVALAEGFGFNNNPDIVAVGLGGATSLGNRDLYRTPYRIENMARRGYASNQTDAEVHGERFTGVRRVAVLDAFCMAVRVSWLRSRGGWPVDKISHHCLDLWLACEAARDKKEIWMVGASCTHWGGGTSTKPIYRDAKWLKGNSLEEDHQAPHRFLYEEYRDVLPISVEG